MKLEKTRVRVPLPEPLFGIVKDILSPNDKTLLVAGWGDKSTDAEIADAFGADAVDRLKELERGLLKLLNFNIDRAAWIEFIDKYRAETAALKTALAELVAGNETNDGAVPDARTNERSGDVDEV